jgi:group I intron endonuclease
MVNYENGKIYKVINDINNDIYIGSTVMKLCRRLHMHKSASKIPANVNHKLYAMMVELGNEHFSIILIENFKCKTVDELTAREQHFIDQLKPLLNRNRAYISEEDRAVYAQTYRGLPEHKLKHKLRARQQSLANQGKFKCEQCKYETCTKQSLDKHFKTLKHIGIVKSIEDIEKIVAN